MKHDLWVVTGAPESGKSTTVEYLLEQNLDFAVFDIDWLIKQGNELIYQRIQDTPASWQPMMHQLGS